MYQSEKDRWPTLVGNPFKTVAHVQPVAMPLRKVRAVTTDWRHAGHAVEIGQEIKLPDDEARGLVALGRAEFV
jgi:hypothetical protein